MVQIRNGKSLVLFYLTFVSLPSTHISLFLSHLLFFSSLPLSKLSLSLFLCHNYPHQSHYIAHKPKPSRLPCRWPHASPSSTQRCPAPMFSTIPCCWLPTFKSLNWPLFIVVFVVVFLVIALVFFLVVDVGWVSWVVIGWCWWVMMVGVGWFWWFGWFWILAMVFSGSRLVS